MSLNQKSLTVPRISKKIKFICKRTNFFFKYRWSGDFDGEILQAASRLRQDKVEEFLRWSGKIIHNFEKIDSFVDGWTKYVLKQNGLAFWTTLEWHCFSTDLALFYSGIKVSKVLFERNMFSTPNYV